MRGATMRSWAQRAARRVVSSLLPEVRRPVAVAGLAAVLAASAGTTALAATASAASGLHTAKVTIQADGWLIGVSATSARPAGPALSSVCGGAMAALGVAGRKSVG